MGYYSDPFETGQAHPRIYFQNGMKNDLDGARETASLIAAITGASIGLIANDTHGIADDTLEYLPQVLKMKDILNEFTYRKIDREGLPTLIVMHSAGNNDAAQALRVGSLYNHQYPNLSFYSLGSPIGNSTLEEIIRNAGSNYIGQVNDWRDPVTYSKTAGGGMIGATGTGVYYGALYGCGVGAGGLLLGCIAGGILGGAIGGIATASPVIYGLRNYHPMTNYLDKPGVSNTLQQWTLNEGGMTVPNQTTR